MTTDYTYIQQLLARYWDAETSLDEERLLRAFFAQKDLPAEFEKYRPLFAAGNEVENADLSDDFDERVLSAIAREEENGEDVVRAKRISLFARLRPLYNAAAAVALIVLTATGAASFFRSQMPGETWDYNASNYQESYDNPQEAYETISEGLDELRAFLSAGGDSTKASTPSDGAKTPQVKTTKQ